MNLSKSFETQFGIPFNGIQVTSPGRINIIGEHTDYNGGFVLPAAIDLKVYLRIQKNDLNTLRVYSVQLNQYVEISISDIGNGNTKIPEWVKYIIGAYSILNADSGIDILIDSKIPIGAGLSSSAALSCGLLMGLSELLDKTLSQMELARAAQQIEHEYIGVNCGLMDQLACILGKSEQAFLLNCETLEWDYTNIEVKGWQWALIDSKVKHSLKDSDYNQQRATTAIALNKIRKKYPDWNHYNRIQVDDLPKLQPVLNDHEFKCVRHLLTENNRTKALYSHLKDGNMTKVGQCLSESHQSLKVDYKVTCEETDFIVDELLKYPEVVGARQMGGGFGGCVLYLLKVEAHSDILTRITEDYAKKYTAAEPIPISIGDGCHIEK